MNRWRWTAYGTHDGRVDVTTGRAESLLAAFAALVALEADGWTIEWTWIVRAGDAS